MDKLIDFLQKEVPSHADDLDDSIKSMLDILDHTCAALANKVARMYQDGIDDKMDDFTEARKQLKNIENCLKGIVDDSNIEQRRELKSSIQESDISKSAYVNENNSIDNIDLNEAHTLYDDFYKTKLSGFTLDGEKYSVRHWVDLLPVVCEILNKRNHKLFESLPDDKDMQGRTRQYFSRKAIYDNSGNKPLNKKISGTNVYVLTNNNGNGTCSVIKLLLERYNIPITSMSIFLRADYKSSRKNEDEESVKKN